MTDAHDVPIGTPAHLRPFLAALGRDEALRFFLKFGGAEMYFPNDPKGNSELAREFGIDAARALGDKLDCGGLKKRVPLAQKWSAQRLWENGLTVADIARRLRVTDSTVRSYTTVERAAGTFNQLSLFEDDKAST